MVFIGAFIQFIEESVHSGLSFHIEVPGCLGPLPDIGNILNMLRLLQGRHFQLNLSAWERIHSGRREADSKQVYTLRTVKSLANFKRPRWNSGWWCSPLVPKSVKTTGPSLALLGRRNERKRAKYGNTEHAHARNGENIANFMSNDCITEYNREELIN
ncbi:hypothetical protein RRG08_019883 [Elysia crispata]|uniref:Uncharacterized protein n=1 Tax=Elysia crispata TaxID=231223 RepID=A0AAE0Z9U4_9GAST|nr:hypothetical protein RRG08_019883 [Elysia crispata]